MDKLAQRLHIHLDLEYVLPVKCLPDFGAILDLKHRQCVGPEHPRARPLRAPYAHASLYGWDSQSGESTDEEQCVVIPSPHHLPPFAVFASDFILDFLLPSPLAIFFALSTFSNFLFLIPHDVTLSAASSYNSIFLNHHWVVRVRNLGLVARCVGPATGQFGDAIRGDHLEVFMADLSYPALALDIGIAYDERLERRITTTMTTP
ncbi:hypothetical protein B0H17DRAFT_1192263 [Mycena rosella]|uniref:Uncharacterized protein n=1 Tax=Mycena rosella TaxID=1033263 RepID=A0AAD7GWM9_MYCRO|nr:hypothetical protein B0H17DRAFT_1192263 [Mycena rosella]